MLSFKSIAGFLKKVGRSREDNSREGHQKGGTNGTYAGASISGSTFTGACASGTTGDASDGGHNRTNPGSRRNVPSSSPNAAAMPHHGDDIHDSNLSEFPTLGMMSTFGDNVTFTSSHILRGLQPNTSNQDVLLHIQRVVRERSEQLQQQEREEEGSLTVSQRHGSEGSNCASEGASVAAAPQKKSPTPTSMAATDGPELHPNQRDYAHLPSLSRRKTDREKPVMAREHLQRIQKMRTEMIDALDVCLQEVPEDPLLWGINNVVTNEGDRARIVKPTTDVQLQERGSGAPEPTMDSNNDGMTEGTKTEPDLVASRQELSMAARSLAVADSTAGLPQETPSPPEFDYYEWRRLLMEIINVLVRIDRALLNDVRLRAIGRLVPASSRVASGNKPEFRWEHLSQVFPTPPALGQTSGSFEVTPSGLRRSQVPIPLACGPMGNSPSGDVAPITSPLQSKNVDSAGFTGMATPREKTVAPLATTTAGRAPSTSTPHSVMKRAVTESSVVSPDPPIDLVVTKEEKKMLEELLTIACSLATWAIVKAILRHHLHALEQRRDRTSLSPLNKAAMASIGSALISADMSASATSAEIAASGSANTTGRPPLAPPAPPPPAAMNSAPCPSDAAESEAGAAATTDGDQGKSVNHMNVMDEVGEIPYIDWAAVVQELAEWIGEQHVVSLAECTLCASFLRDDGREMVLCMLQTPKPRKLLSNIHQNADKLRRAHLDSLSSGASPPRVVTAATAPAGGSTPAAAASSGSAPTGSASPLPSSGAPSSSSGSGAAAAVPPTGTSASTAPTGATSFHPTPKRSYVAPTAGASFSHNTTRAMLEDPTLVMDDLVARLEMIYRKAVANTWASYLEDAIEADMRYLSITSGAANMVHGISVVGDPVALSTSPGVAHFTSAGEESTRLSSEPLATGASSPPVLTPPHQERMTDTKTLCRLATAFFFGSDAWSENKRERLFTLLFRSMRGRMEQYSESAATRRNLRRGTSCLALSTQTPPVSGTSLEPHPFSEVPTTGAPAATTAPSSTGASPSQSLSNPPHVSANAPSAPNATTSLTPTKFSVEDTSTRASPPGGGASAFSTVGGVGTPTTARHGVAPSPQLAVQQILSSNGSTTAISTHSTPLTASLLASRDVGNSDVEMTVPGVGGGLQTYSDVFTAGQTDRPTAWTPFAFAMTPSEPSTPPPEQHRSSSSTTAHRIGEEGHQEGGEDHAGRRAMETSALSIPTVNLHASAPGVHPAASKGGYSALESLMLERIVNMSWSAALHKRGEQCLTAKPPRLEEAEQDALEERLVASAFGEFRARQRAIVSLINARLASGKSVEALTNAQKHFKFEKKDWTSHNQTIFSAMRYLQSMVFLVRAQAACRVYGAVIETVQFVLPQAALCEQMLQVLAPRPRGDYILRFGDCRSKLLRSYVYLLKEGWLAHAAFNDLAKAEKYFLKCAQVMQMLRRRVRETELFAAYMERGAQLMKLKEYKQSLGLFRCAVNIAKKSLQGADTAANVSGESSTFSPGTTAGSCAPSPSSSMANMESAVSVAATGLGAKIPPTASQKHFHRNLHLRAAGSGSLTTAEEHIPGVTDAVEDDLELVWRVAESERMLALSFVTQAEHEVNVRERREELSNAVTSAYSSQRSLQRWQRMGGTPKRLLTAVPCSLIVICKGLLLLNQPRKAALLLEPLIENKPNSALVRPPMWEEILHPTEDPYTTEDVVLRTYVSSVKIAVFMLYARCLAEFDGDRALRAVTQLDQLLQESDAWICTIRTELRHALENLAIKDKAVVGHLSSSHSSQRMEALRRGGTVSPHGAAGHGRNSEDGEDKRSSRKPSDGKSAESVDIGSGAALAAAKGTARTIEVPHLQMPTSHSSTGSPSPVDEGRYSQGWNSSDDAPLRLQHVIAGGTDAKAASTSAMNEPSLGEDPASAVVDDDNRSRRSMSIQLSGAGGERNEADASIFGNSTTAAPAIFTATSSPPHHHSSTGKNSHLAPIRVHTESSSECITALFALREAKSHIRKALRGMFIISGDAHSLIKNWEEALKVYSHALVITMSEVEAASAAAQSRRCAGRNTPRTRFAPPTPPKGSKEANKKTPLSARHYVYKSPSKHHEEDGGNCLQGWGPVVPLDEEFFLWDEEDVLIADNLVNRELTASTAAKDLRAVVADEERMDSRACESVVLSKLAKVYHALDKPTTAIHYHTLVMEYANECNDKLLAYNSVLSLARLYTAANMSDKARDAWAKVSELAKEYEDKEVSRETMRNIVAGQEAAGMYMEVVKTAEELEKLATGEEGEDAARDSRFALEALANANLQLGQFDACIAALDSREKVQEKSAEWSGALLSMRAKARMGLNKSAEAIKVMHSWAAKARTLGNWVELGKANSALSAAYASENQNTQARRHHEAALKAFALVESLDEECRHIALDSARWLVHYAYLDETTVQVDPALTYAGSSANTSDSETNDGHFRYTTSDLENASGDLGAMLAREEKMRHTSSMFGEDSAFEQNDDDDDFGGDKFLSNQSMFGGRPLGRLLDKVTIPHAEGDEEREAAAALENDAPSIETSFTSPMLGPKDSSYSTQSPSFASGMKASIRGSSTHTDDIAGSGKYHSEGSSSSPGQSDGGDNEVGEDVEDEARQRLEVDAAPCPIDAEAVPEHRQDPQRSGSIEGDDAASSANLKKPPPKSATVPPTPTVTTAALKPTTNTSTVTGSGAQTSKSASSNYVPPPTSLANVSICSRPAAAAAGTDVLELQADVNRPSAEQASHTGPASTSSPLLTGFPRGSAFPVGSNPNAVAAAAAAATACSGGEDDHSRERRPSTVRTTYFRGAIEIIETAAQMLLVPRSGRHIVIPYSPAEAVDFALLTHAQSLFVFYFAEYTTEYGAQCDVIVRPPRTANFIKLRVQVSLKEYHKKDGISALMASTSTEISMTGDHNNAVEVAGPSSLSAHPFGTTMARGATGSSVGSPTLSSGTSAALRASLDEETSTCLRNLYADAWQPIADRMQREHVAYQDAETLIIMPDVSMMHLPFAGFLPSPIYSDEEAPLGEQFTMIVTPSMTHFVNHGMTQQPKRRNEMSGALDPTADKYIFLPYDSHSCAGAAAPNASLATPTNSPNARFSPIARQQQQQHQQQQQQSKNISGGAEASNVHTLLPLVGPTSNKEPVQSTVAPLVLSAHSFTDSLPTGHPTAASAAVDDTSMHSNHSLGDTLSATPSSRPKPEAQQTAKMGTFDELLRTWRVYRGCTRKELIQAFTDVHTRALIFLAPIDQGSVRVADGVVTIHDLAQNLLQIRAQQQLAASTCNPFIHASAPPQSAAASSSNGASLVGNNTTGSNAAAPPPPPLLIPPLCTHMDLLVLTANRSQYPTVSDAGASAKLCMELGVHRVLRLNIIHGLSPNDEQCTFISIYLANLEKVMRWSLRNPYAVALRTTIAEARKQGMSSSTWGAFTLVGNP